MWTRNKCVVSGYVLVLVTISSFSTCSSDDGEDADANKHDCHLPNAWNGIWSRDHLEDDAPPLIINETSIMMEMDSKVLTCVKQLDHTYYIFKENNDDHCYRCLVIYEKHHNVIQYRESECDTKPEFDDCKDILGPYGTLFSIFRIDAKIELCPFAEKRMTLDYSTNGRRCPYQGPHGSYIESCSNPGTFLFNYEACVDVDGTEKFSEELTCHGSWSAHSYNYFLGKVSRTSSNGRHEDAGFKCFSWAEIRLNKTSPITGYQLSRSGETGSCAHAQAPDDGSWKYVLEVKETKYAEFPSWLEVDDLGESRWNVLNLTFQFGINVAGGKIQMVPNHLHTTSHAKWYSFTASRVDELTTTSATLEVIEVVGCKRLPVCMDMHQRHESILEVELFRREPESNPNKLCHHEPKNKPHLTYTLVKERPRPVPSPVTGLFKLDVPTLSTHKDHVEKCDNSTLEVQFSPEHYLEVGCRGKASSGLDFYSACDVRQGLQFVSGLDSIGSWKEDKDIFIVTNNSMFRLPGYRCLKLTPISSSAYSVIIFHNDCKPSSNVPLSNWTFNANFSSPCDHIPAAKQTLYTSSNANNFYVVTLQLIIFLNIGFFSKVMLS